MKFVQVIQNLYSSKADAQDEDGLNDSVGNLVIDESREEEEAHTRYIGLFATGVLLFCLFIIASDESQSPPGGLLICICFVVLNARYVLIINFIFFLVLWSLLLLTKSCICLSHNKLMSLVL